MQVSTVTIKTVNKKKKDEKKLVTCEENVYFRMKQTREDYISCLSIEKLAIHDEREAIDFWLHVLIELLFHCGQMVRTVDSFSFIFSSFKKIN